MAKPSINRRAIRDRDQIAVLASAVRQELLDTLAAQGGRASVAALADQLGRHADGLYYHLRVLRDAGLIKQVGTQRASEKIYALAGTGSAPMRLAYDTGPAGNAEALSRYAAGLLNVAASDFNRALDSADVTVDGPYRDLWAARNKGWVSKADIAKINRLLEQLCVLTSQPRGDGREHLHSLVFVHTPCAPVARRRGQ